METTLNKISDVEYELEIRSPAEELKPELDQALRAQRKQTQAKGFRPGKVPLAMVKKLYGRELAFGVAEQHVQKTYNEQILDNDDYDVVGQPILAELEYDMDTDLRAVIRFGTRPEVELQDLDGVTIPALKLEVTDELVKEQVEEFRRRSADLTPTDEPAGETDQVVFDLQEVDVETNTPIIGRREEGQEFFLDDSDLTDEWKQALTGRKAGDTFRADISHGDAEHAHIHRYDVTLHEVKRRELPEFDEETIRDLTKDEAGSVEDLEQIFRDQLNGQMEEQRREQIESQIVRKMLELHPVPVPKQAVDLYLDSFVEDVKQQSRGSLPEGFDEEAFRESNRPGAEEQARWMFIRDRIISEHELEATDEDIDQHFEDMSSNEDFSSAMMRQYYDQLGMTDRVREQLLSRKVFDLLKEQVSIEELDEEAYAEAIKAQREADEEPVEAASADDASDEEGA